MFAAKDDVSVTHTLIVEAVVPKKQSVVTRLSPAGPVSPLLDTDAKRDRETLQEPVLLTGISLRDSNSRGSPCTAPLFGLPLGVPCAVPVGLRAGPLLRATLGLPDTLAGTDREGVAPGVGGGVATTNTPELSSTLGVTPVTFANRKHARLGSIPAHE